MRNLEAIHPNDWPYANQAQAAINAPGNGSGHERITFGIVQDPETPVCYFATRSAIYLPPPAATGDLFVGIYAYNTQDGTFHRLFKRQSAYDFDTVDVDTLETFYVLGIESGSLIVQILTQAPPKNPAALWDIPFGSHASGPVKIDLRQPYAKRPPYERPAP